MEGVWNMYSGGTLDHLGAIPFIILPRSLDDRPVAEQVQERYAHGGGWSPYGKGKWKRNPSTGALKYPGDPALPTLASVRIGDELVTVHAYAIVCVVQPDGSFEVSRMD
jgi:hypothetical protein